MVRDLSRTGRGRGGGAGARGAVRAAAASLALGLVVTIGAPGRGASLTAAAGPPPGGAQVESMDSIAQGYVKLVLAVGQHDADYVDAYYGPPEWKDEAA